jgi:hypothetical protein
MGLEWAHAKLLSQGESPTVVGFGRLGNERVGVGMGDAKLLECERLVPAILELPGQVEPLACVLPGLLAASRQTKTSLSHAQWTARRPPVRILSLIPSSSSARPSVRRPWSA